MNKIDLIPELYCSDLYKTVDFYTKTLGFIVLFKRIEERFCCLQKGNAQIMFEELGAGRQWITGELQKPFGRGVNFQIEVDAIDELHEKIITSGYALFLPIENKWYRQNENTVGNRQFIVQDPNGYLLRFYQQLIA